MSLQPQPAFRRAIALAMTGAPVARALDHPGIEHTLGPGWGIDEPV